ncbi:SWIM zinc finger family protein [Streptomyces sp. NPDC008343]|uniref:SWIM zinc finger family protein n=1 Tax=Streptomyces sp. NPDC008343 TaxID=3364828 RepID=UPI0036F00DAD
MSDVRSRTYVRPSAVSGTRWAPLLSLETGSGSTPYGTAPHPHFFSGFLTASQATADGLLAVADVARTRYLGGASSRAGYALDPVVTGHDDRLRFESLSPCRGVYARLDLLGDGVNGARIQRGTSYVDVNAALLGDLGRISSRHPLRLSVGPIPPRETTEPGGQHVRKQNRLSQRRLEGFGDAQVLASGLDLRAEVPRARGQHLVRSLARLGQPGLWALPVSGDVRLMTVPSQGAVSVPDAGRLAALQLVVAHMTALRLYAPPDATDATDATDDANTASVWEAVLPGMRLTVVPLRSRQNHFSGESAAAEATGIEQIRQDAELLSVLLAWEARIDPAALAEQAGLTLTRTRAALAWLSAEGRCGYDTAEAAHFHRELPFHVRKAGTDHPRLVAARALVEAGAVTLDQGSGTATVVSRGTAHQVRDVLRRRACTCSWWSRHRGSRGLCEHALAAVVAQRQGHA